MRCDLRPRPPTPRQRARVFLLSLFFSITRPPMRHLRGHVAITQLPTTWQLGQERGLIAEHQAVFASVFSVLGRNFCVGRRRNSVSPRSFRSTSHREHFRRQTELSSPTDVLPNLPNFLNLRLFPPLIDSSEKLLLLSEVNSRYRQRSDRCLTWQLARSNQN